MLIGGTMVIFFLRLVLSGLVGAAFAAGVAVLAIAALGREAWRDPQPTQQAADNVYYLGLLFTLLSLILALVQLFVFGQSDEATRTHELVGNFGIALVSTVVGIVGRVLLQGKLGRENASAHANQGAGTEPSASDMAGGLPSEEMRELREEIRQARDAFNHFTRITLSQAEQTRTHTERLVGEFTEHINRLAESELGSAGQAWRETAASMRNEATEFAQRMAGAVEESAKRNEAVWERAANHMNLRAEDLVARVTRVVDETAARSEAAWQDSSARTEQAWRAITSRADEAIAETGANLANLEGDVAATVDQLASVSRDLPSLAVALDQAESSLRRLGHAAEVATTGLEARATEIVAAHNVLATGIRRYAEASVEQTQGILGDVAKQVQAQLAGVAGDWTDVVKRLEGAGGRQQEAAERAADAAERLARRMSEEVEDWADLAARTRESLVGVVDDLTAIVRKG